MNSAEHRITGTDGRLTATFVPEVGMVCASVTVDGEERLDPRRGLDAYRERGKTMGIPLLYPWANRVATRQFEVADRAVSLPEPGTTIGIDEHGLPIHGVQPRLMRWTASGDGPALQAELDWRDPDLLTIFPFAHSVAFEAAAGPGAELRIAVTVRADGADRVPVAFGLHPYLRLPELPRERCRIELPPCRGLAVDRQGIPTGEQTPLGPSTVPLERSWDDGLALDQPTAAFAASGGSGRVTVELLEGYSYGQVFSPDEAEFICFEPMTAPANALVSGEGLRVLAPGQSWRASFRIAWEVR